MAVNINYQGDIYDADGNKIDCYYQAFSYSISKWSDLRQSEYNQYNVNFGDGDLNGQDGSVKVGDPLVVVFWTGDSDRNNELELFSVIVFVYDGTDSTIQDVQLLGPHNPSCSFSLADTALVESTVYATSSASTTYQWNFAGLTHYQRVTWYGQTIFGFLGISEDLFDFGDGFSTTRSHVYHEGGTFDVHHLVKSTYDGYESTCSDSIRIYYRSPSGSISFSDNNPILGDTITVYNTISDIDSRITNIKYYFDGQLMHEGTELSYDYEVTLDSMGTHNAEIVIYWNDYFNDNTYSTSKSFTMQNQAPTLELVVDTEYEETGRIIVEANADDVDGYINNICWKLYYQAESSGLPHPYFKCAEENIGDFREIYSYCDKDMTSLDMTFAIPGLYKVDVRAYDDLGASVLQTVELPIEYVCDGVLGECPECPECKKCPDGSTPLCPDEIPECPDCPECPECPDCPELPECPDCPECPDVPNCDEEVAEAIKEVSKKYLDEIRRMQQVIHVSEDGTGNPIVSEINPGLDGELSSGKIKSTSSSSIEGEIASGSLSGAVGGKISGTIKKS